MKAITVVACTACLLALGPCSYGQRFATLYNIADDFPVGLTQTGGVLYGATDAGSGTGNCGTVFELLPPALGGGSWTPVVLHSFIFGIGGPDGCVPLAAPLLGAGGVLHGVTSQGGVNSPPNFGTLYGVRPPAIPGGTWTETVLYDFGTPGTNIDYPTSSLVKGPRGSFYVASSTPNLCHLLPPASPGGAWTAKVIYSLRSPPPAIALNSLVAGPGGVLYGTSSGGPHLGEVVQFTPPADRGGAWTETLLHMFTGVGNQLATPLR